MAKEESTVQFPVREVKATVSKEARERAEKTADALASPQERQQRCKLGIAECEAEEQAVNVEISEHQEAIQNLTTGRERIRLKKAILYVRFHGLGGGQ